MCSYGAIQSPVYIVESDTKECRNMEIEWNFSPGEKLPTAKYDGHEIVIEGDFGNFIFS